MCWRISVFEGNYDLFFNKYLHLNTSMLKNFRFWRELRLCDVICLNDINAVVLKNFRFWRELRQNTSLNNLTSQLRLCWRISVFEGNYDKSENFLFKFSDFNFVEEFPFLKGITTREADILVPKLCEVLKNFRFWRELRRGAKISDLYAQKP